MRTNKKYLENFIFKSFLTLSILFLISGCIEEIELDTQNFESLLVIEANITNENKQQIVLLSRTFQFEDSGPSQESGASVSVFGNGTLISNFIETNPGVYISSQAFAVQPNIEYTLDITTQNGRSYVSSPSQLPEEAIIESISVQPSKDSFNNQGVSILVNSSSPQGQGSFYKFVYEETYKIIAPKWRFEELFPLDEFDVSNCEVIVGVKQQQERVCYNTTKSIEIILAETIGQPQDRLNNFETRFIKLDNTIIAHRYSILLKQHTISSEVHTYFKKRNEFSIENNSFSQVQPGFIEGNIESVQSPNDEKVIGIFYTSTVSELRFFFNWADIFPNKEPPQIFCQVFSPRLRREDCSQPMPVCCPLKSFVANNQVKYFGENNEPDESEGPYLVVSRECGDCTANGSNIIPEFWEE